MYQDIIDVKYAAMDGLAVWEEVEQAVLKLFDTRKIETVSTDHMDFSRRHKNYHDRSMKILWEKPAVIYQPWFVVEDLFCKSDFLVLNEEGQYDLLEIKAKNSVRQKNKDAELLPDMLADISFQAYIMTRVMWDLFSGKCFFLHVNKQYVRQWEVDYAALIRSDNVSDELMTDDHLEGMVQSVKQLKNLDKQWVDDLYPYDGTQNYHEYFWEPKPDGSIRKIPYLGKKVLPLCEQGKRKLDELNAEDALSLYNKKWEPTKQSIYVDLWLQGDETIIDTNTIKEEFDSRLQFPLFFYDYETVKAPVPLFDGTSPRQQTVVQYSCHKLDADGTITHTEDIIWLGVTDNKSIIQTLVDNLELGTNGTYIVRNQSFEMWRNKELAKQYPEFAEALLTINGRTFDLMEVFSKLYYFDRRFWWSASIKSVLPVLTDISYKDLTISNGWISSDLLEKLARGTLDQSLVDQTTADLLEYCKLDTRAMVRIYEEILNVI